MGTHRTERVGALLQHAIAEMLLREVRDPRLRGATITHVDVSSDLRHATVYYCLRGTEADRLMADEAFARAAGYVQRKIGRELGLRYTPELRFAFDRGLDRLRRLEQLLAEESGPQPDAGSDLTESHGRHPTRR